MAAKSIKFKVVEALLRLDRQLGFQEIEKIVPLPAGSIPKTPETLNPLQQTYVFVRPRGFFILASEGLQG